MKRSVFLLLLIFQFGVSAWSQTQEELIFERPLNNLYLGFLGDLSLIAVNYERLFEINSRVLLAGQLGVGYNEEFQLCFFGPCQEPAEKFVTFPVRFSGLLGKKKHFLEVGVGGTLVYGSSPHPYYVYPLVGYRLQPLVKQKMVFRVFALYPFKSRQDQAIMPIPMGLSLGVAF
ncbi:hypothetical protein E7Z59_05975 [Robertkochia marina]|uniref:DUF3575 domain-containing protein n=1 Tax=Robertkochia marina TaxID=1227945 RepID=A0A4S3M3W0_9FLAO|nr:hypothetical protein [Robertkochia marina]THD69872.1 hypothetical protein E7Z59_05975 [Robertkochia marina]TRZ46781.1 hypothetical protein D3A96_04225 [Robertkochia marina]